jgi:hypothetical protein
LLHKDLDATKLSAALKSELRMPIESVQKRGIVAKKRLLARRVNLGLNGVREEVESALLSRKRLLVLNLDIGAHSKAPQKVIKEIWKITPELAFMGIRKEDAGKEGRVLCFAIVPDAPTKETGFKADELLKDVLDSVGVCGGGKPGSAMEQVPQCNEMVRSLLGLKVLIMAPSR